MTKQFIKLIDGPLVDPEKVTALCCVNNPGREDQYLLVIHLSGTSMHMECASLDEYRRLQEGIAAQILAALGTPPA